MTARWHEATEAFDVLADESRRTAYDRLRALFLSGGAASLPSASPVNLTPEQAAKLAAALRELAASRRSTSKTKHPPCEVSVGAALAEMQSGTVVSVSVSVASIDGSGRPCQRIQSVHVIVPRGSGPFFRETFEGKGHETAQFARGDIVVNVRELTGGEFRRSPTGPQDVVWYG